MNLTLNVSEMENPFSDDADEFEPLTFPPGPIYNILYSITDLLKIAVVPTVIVLDILIICAIYKNAKLNTRINAYILHYAITNLIYISVYVISMVTIFSSILDFGARIFFLVYVEIEHTAYCFNMILMSCLALDWLLIAYKPEVIEKFQKPYNYYFFMFYGLALIHLVINIILRLPNSHEYAPSYFIQVVLILTIVLLITANYLSYAKKNSNDTTRIFYGLKVSTLVTSASIPSYILHIIYANTKKFPGDSIRLFWLFQQLADVIGFSTAIFVFYVICTNNMHFKATFKKMCCCWCRKAAKEDGTDILDDAASIGRNSIRRNFEYTKPSETIISVS